MDDQKLQPWFEGVSGAVLLFKVNRRPRPQTLFDDGQPEDVLDHLTEALLFGEQVVTGRKVRRTWLLGNREIDLHGRTLAGQVGWERHDPAATDVYDSEQQQWVDVVEQKGRSARSVFVFDVERRFLAVVKHPSFSDTVLPKVFSDLLNRGEALRTVPTTDWDVEPILDEAGFRDWLAATHAVERVRFVAKLPNPAGLDPFEGVWRRLERLSAGSIEETIQARDPETGLTNVTSDPVSAEYLAMAGHAFGYITATGTSDGRLRKYDQRQKVKRIYLEFPSTWRDLMVAVKHMLQRSDGSEY
jgi:hypothetical protein